MAEIRRETGVLSRDFTGGGPAVCVWSGGEGKVSSADASPREIHRVSGDFLLPDGQPLSYSSGGAADVGWWAFGQGSVEAIVSDLQ